DLQLLIARRLDDIAVRVRVIYAGAAASELFRGIDELERIPSADVASPDLRRHALADGEGDRVERGEHYLVPDAPAADLLHHQRNEPRQARRRIGLDLDLDGRQLSDNIQHLGEGRD